jgi:anti-anti-sigma factor
MSLQVVEVGSDTEVRLSAECLGEPAVHETQRTLLRLAGSKRLRLDFGAAGPLTGSALGVLVAVRRRVRSAGGQLVLANLSPAHHEVLRVTGLDRLFGVRREEPVCGVA